MSPESILLDKLSIARRMLRIVGTAEFKEIYKSGDKVEIEKIISALDRVAFDNLFSKNLENMSSRELRVIAAARHIPYYSRLDKTTLLKELKGGLDS